MWFHYIFYIINQIFYIYQFIKDIIFVKENKSQCEHYIKTKPNGYKNIHSSSIIFYK